MGGLKLKNPFVAIRLILLGENLSTLEKLSLLLSYLIGIFKARCMILDEYSRWIHFEGRRWHPFFIFSGCTLDVEIPAHVVLDIDDNDKIFISEIRTS